MRNPQPGGRLSEDTEHLLRERWVGLRVTMWTGGDSELSCCPASAQISTICCWQWKDLRKLHQAPLTTVSCE